MPYARPTLDELRAQIAADLAAALPGDDPLLPVSNLRVLGDVQAEGFNSATGYLDWIARQAVPFTATDEAFEGWAALKGATRKPATQATGSATWTGTPGTVLPAGTALTRSDGVGYVTTAEQTVGGGGTVTATIEAVKAGSAGTLASGDVVVISNAIGGIGSAGTVTPATPGVDVEGDDAFRTRVLAIYADPPQGGAAADYIKWAREVPGVTRSWAVGSAQGAGTVNVYFMMDEAESAHGGFPQGTDGVATAETRDTVATGDQLAVADYIYPLRPVTALVYAVAPKQNVVAFTINLPGATQAVKDAIEASIDATFVAYGAPGGVVDNSDIEAGIRAIAGSGGFVITTESCTHGSVGPTNGNITSSAGYLPVKGVVTWT